MPRRPANAALLLLLLILLSACQSVLDFGGPSSGASLATDRVKLLVEEDGLYQVTPAQLREAGLDVDALAAETARLSSAGETVPALYRDGALIFYGQGSDNRYYAARPYILELGAAGETIPAAEPGPQPTSVIDTVPQTIHLEENALYISEARQTDGDDVWFWSKLSQGESFAAQVDLPAVGGESAVLRVNALGVTHNREVEGDHDFDVLLNGEAAGSVVWDGPVAHTAEITLPAGALQVGGNSILLDNRPPGANFLDIMQVNWLELDYRAPAEAVDGRLTFSGEDALVRLRGFDTAPLLFDVSDPAQPRQITAIPGSAGVVEVPASAEMRVAAAAPQAIPAPRIAPMRASAWRDETQQADLLVVTTDALVPAFEPLVAAREAQGLVTAVVPVEEIYDAFGDGAPSPESIQAFVRYTHEQWQQPHPRYLLLAGDATSDYRGYLGELPANHVPSPMVAVQFSGETVSDARLADVDGDLRSDLAVGRWPVNSAAEVSDLIERTLAYENEPASPRTLFATDGSEEIFSAIAARLLTDAALPAADNVQLDGPSADEIAAAWQDGAWLATYVGHGSIDRWGKEDILDLTSVADLSSTAAPIVVQLTCLTGLFSHPEQISLAEAMLSEKDGPVLVIAASSLTLSAHQEPFATALYQSLQDPALERVGDAFLAAKLGLDVENSNGLREISDTFGLLGDPSARIARP